MVSLDRSFVVCLGVHVVFWSVGRCVSGLVVRGVSLLFVVCIGGSWCVWVDGLWFLLVVHSWCVLVGRSWCVWVGGSWCVSLSVGRGVSGLSLCWSVSLWLSSFVVVLSCALSSSGGLASPD